MKKIFLLFFIFIVGASAQTSLFQSIVKNVSIENTKKAIEDAKILQKDLNDENFRNFIKSWKKVEAIYLAGEINSDLVDIPRYVDVFNNLKEDLNSQLQRVIEGENDLKKALYKNSFKSVNALEYVLYSNDNLTQRHKEMAKEILFSIISHLENIKIAYESYLKNPAKTVQEENAILINSLIASSYRLKEWRVGNPSGYSSRYKNDPKNSRSEYFLSKNSFASIKAILDAQKEIIEEKEYKNLYDLAKEKNAINDLKIVVENINKAKNILDTLKTDDFLNAKELFDTVAKIHDLYYVSIIQKLGLKPEILDADGD
jgi:predicted lipoprotein